MIRQEQAPRITLPEPSPAPYAGHSTYGHQRQGRHARQRTGRLSRARRHVAALDAATRHAAYTAGTTLIALIAAMIYIASMLHR